MTAPITIQPILNKDFEEISSVESAAFHEDELSLALFGPNRASPEMIKMRAALIEKEFSKATSYMAKAVTADGAIVGVAEWGFYPQGRPEEEWNGRGVWPKGANVAFCTALFRTFRGLMRKAVDGKPCASLITLVVLPEYQRKGIGAMLLREGLEKADEAGLPTVLGASAKGIGLYRKMGFVDGEVLEMDLRPYGMEGSIRHVVMVRPEVKLAGLHEIMC